MEIDVSGCAFYNNGKCNNPNGMACNCCNNAYCYYKELQQLKAENDELKKQIKSCKECAEQLGKHKVAEQCLDEIEEYLNQYEMLGKLNIKYLLQLIKQAKEGGEC